MQRHLYKLPDPEGQKVLFTAISNFVTVGSKSLFTQTTIDNKTDFYQYALLTHSTGLYNFFQTKNNEKFYIVNHIFLVYKDDVKRVKQFLGLITKKYTNVNVFLINKEETLGIVSKSNKKIYTFIAVIHINDNESETK